ncbi:MAG TPA: TIGR03016 family PEP-CTERM system-associated outer membrane protein [Nitrosospira sp.]|jgi:uncharacterized protein (PEP-CTERM system associated)|nr:TIGR03016 family PEP-CTERM system-associated outer membrane protein [Nitrosospira sp.]
MLQISVKYPLTAAWFIAMPALLLLPFHSQGQVQTPLGVAQGQLPQFQSMAGNNPAMGGGTMGAGWRVLPRLSLVETYSDNVRLQQNGQQDLVTQINPGLIVNGVGRRYTVNIDYTMNNLIYANLSNFNRIRHQLNAMGTAELVKDFFFVDGRAIITQQNANLFGAQGINNVNVTGNRADVHIYNISPYIRHRFQDLATTELRYTRNMVSSSSSALFNSQADGFQAGINSGTAFSTLQWGLNYSHQAVHYDRSNRTVEFERSIASLRYMITPHFGLTGTGGYERNTFISIRGSPSSPTWTAGFIWEPSPRTSVAFNAGQRFYGDTYSALASHRTRMTAWDLSYDENITTFNQQAGLGGGSTISAMGSSLSQLLSAQNPGMSSDVIQQATNSLLGLGLQGQFFDPNNFFSNRLFLQKRLMASVAMNGTRNTVVLRGFDMRRKAFSPEGVDAGLIGIGNTSLLNNTRQSGFNALWTYRISQLTRASIDFTYTRFAFLTVDRVDNLGLARISLSREFPQIMPNFVGMLQYRHNLRDSSQPGLNYRENAVVGTLSMSF